MAASCWYCGEAVPSGAPSCPKCGSKPRAVEAPKPWWRTNAVRIAAGIGILSLLCCGAICVPGLLAASPSANETSAIAVLRRLSEAQSKFMASRNVDADGDGRGEAGTLLELTGSCGVRRGIRSPDEKGHVSSGFEVVGDPLFEPLVSASLSLVGDHGVVKRSGYCFILYLPDSSEAGGWVHETGPRERPSLEGGTGRVGVDPSERKWCAYAWPLLRGETGNRCFFVDEFREIRMSSNEIAKWEGAGRIPPGGSAFVAPASTTAPAAGTVGQDGDLWKVTH